MADLGTTTAQQRGDAGLGEPSARKVKRARNLPSGRAVVGGFLVMLAAVGTFVAYANATAAPRIAWVTATRDLRVGQVISGDDLAMVPIDLPVLQAAESFNATSVLIGAVVIDPINANELVQQSDVAASSPQNLQQVSFALPGDRALGGKIKPNDRVDVLATFGSGPSAFTIVVARGALVIDEIAAEAALGGGERQFTMGLATPGEAIALAHALNAGELTIIRASLLPDGSPGPGLYRLDTDGTVILGDLPTPPTPTATQAPAPTPAPAQSAPPAQTVPAIPPPAAPAPAAPAPPAPAPPG